MPNERIHKLAAKWGVTSRDIIERLDRMGITGKKAQSSLSEGEAERIKGEMGIGGMTPTIDPIEEQRTVVTKDETGAASSISTVTERRVAHGMVRRRTRRTGRDAADVSPFPALVAGNLAVATAVDLDPSRLTAFDPNEFASASLSLGLAVVEEETATPEVEIPAVSADETTVPTIEPDPESPNVETEGAPAVEAKAPIEPVTPAEEEPSDPEPEPAPPAEEPPIEEEVVPIDEPDKLAEEMLSLAEQAEKQQAEAEAGDAEETDENKPGGAKVLGRIDLNKKTKPVMPAGAAKTGPEDTAKEDSKPGRKKKRKVVKKEDMFDALERSFQARQRRPMKRRVAPGQKIAKTELTTPKAIKRVVRINDVTTPGELAKSMGVKAGEVLGVLMRLGVMKSINDVIDLDTTTLVAEEFEYRVENTAVNVEELLQTPEGQDEAVTEEVPRPPVVTVMGHVDHGKTSLLDVIRQANVVDTESGGITQHIGAYMVKTSAGNDICFLDTPGHAAFTEMRARGASITDVVILVVAADDGVMPQTVEAVNHAKAAEIPIVVAVNKMDRPDANPDRIKQQLSEYGVQPEDWGGDTQFIPVSAIQKTGIDELLDAVNLQAEVLELSAPLDRLARGIVIEARLDKGRGPVATVLVQQGKLARGDYFVVGETTGRVRAMSDHAGRQVTEATPSHAVELIGLDDVPQAGDMFDAVEDLNRAAQVAERRQEITKKQQAAATSRMSLEDLQLQIAAGDVQELKVIVKADVQGSAEAVKQALEKLSNDEVALSVIHQAVGGITESDVQLAMASKAVVVGFHVRPDAKARTLAERENVDLRLHTVIYEAIDEVKAALEGLLQPDFKEVVEGQAEVRDTFTVPGGVTIAGSYVTEGNIQRGHLCRLLRDSVVIHESSVSSLRRFKDDVREVQTGYECGIGIDKFNDIKVGDVIECYRMDEVKRTLDV